MTARSFLALTISLLCCVGCERVDAPVVGRYRATIEVDRHELPFLLDIAREDDRYVLILPNAGERLRIADVRVTGRELDAQLPKRSTLQVTAGRTQLRGTLTIIDTQGLSHALALHAKLGESTLFFDESLTDNADIEGRWEVALRTGSGDAAPALALLDQDHDRIVGTLTLASGEAHALHGQVHDEEVQLAVLSWNDARVYRLKVTAAGAMHGEGWHLNGVHEYVEAKRNPDAMLNDTQARRTQARERSTT